MGQLSEILEELCHVHCFDCSHFKSVKINERNIKLYLKITMNKLEYKHLSSIVINHSLWLSVAQFVYDMRYQLNPMKLNA